MLFVRGGKGRYRTFAELVGREREGIDFVRHVVQRGTRVAIVAPHGGAIEGGTTEIARAVAGSEFSLYTFDGTKPHGNGILHLRSVLFDDPECLAIVSHAETVVTIHGARGKRPILEVGGRDESLGAALTLALRDSGIPADLARDRLSGSDPQNICNRGASGRGVQLEISQALRSSMFEGLLREEREYTTPVFRAFVGTVRRVLIERNGGPASVRSQGCPEDKDQDEIGKGGGKWS